MNILIFLIIMQSFFVILSKNPIASVLFLMGVYICTSIVLLILGAEFVAIILIIIYVGAVSILFIFVIMLLNVRIVEVYTTIIHYIPIGLFIGCFFFGEVIFMILNDYGFSYYINTNGFTLDWIYDITPKSNLHVIGEIFYNEYFYLLWIAGLLLLLAMIGAIALTIDVDARHIYLSRKSNYLTPVRPIKSIIFLNGSISLKNKLNLKNKKIC